MSPSSWKKNSAPGSWWKSLREFGPPTAMTMNSPSSNSSLLPTGGFELRAIPHRSTRRRLKGAEMRMARIIAGRAPPREARPTRRGNARMLHRAPAPGGWVEPQRRQAPAPDAAGVEADDIGVAEKTRASTNGRRRSAFRASGRPAPRTREPATRAAPFSAIPWRAAPSRPSRVDVAQPREAIDDDTAAAPRPASASSQRSGLSPYICLNSFSRIAAAAPARIRARSCAPWADPIAAAARRAAGTD